MSWVEFPTGTWEGKVEWETEEGRMGDYNGERMKNSPRRLGIVLPICHMNAPGCIREMTLQSRSSEHRGDHVLSLMEHSFFSLPYLPASNCWVGNSAQTPG